MSILNKIEGLLYIERRRGTFISEFSLKSMVDILELKSNLEGLAAFLASQTPQETVGLFSQ